MKDVPKPSGHHQKASVFAFFFESPIITAKPGYNSAISASQRGQQWQKTLELLKVIREEVGIIWADVLRLVSTWFGNRNCDDLIDVSILGKL